MRIIPLASDSLGTRSMCTFVETSKLSFVIDPGVALGPKRYGLAPHVSEFERLQAHWKLIVGHAEKADVLVVTHYHYDHHNPSDSLYIYKNKLVFVKHPEQNINKSQFVRAKFFLEQIETLAKEIVYADNSEYEFNSVKIKFSKAVTHGANNKLGYVIETLVEENGFKFLHTSDIEGPCNKPQAEFIFENKPNMLFLDGPLSYMLHYRYAESTLQNALQYMRTIIEEVSPEHFIIDHHFLRDLHWKECLNDLFEFADKNGTKLQTAAEFLGLEDDMLEAHRKDLYASSYVPKLSNYYKKVS